MTNHDGEHVDIAVRRAFASTPYSLHRRQREEKTRDLAPKYKDPSRMQLYRQHRLMQSYHICKNSLAHLNMITNFSRSFDIRILPHLNVYISLPIGRHGLLHDPRAMDSVALLFIENNTLYRRPVRRQNTVSTTARRR